MKPVSFSHNIMNLLSSFYKDWFSYLKKYNIFHLCEFEYIPLQEIIKCIPQVCFYHNHKHKRLSSLIYSDTICCSILWSAITVSYGRLIRVVGKRRSTNANIAVLTKNDILIKIRVIVSVTLLFLTGICFISAISHNFQQIHVQN